MFNFPKRKVDVVGPIAAIRAGGRGCGFLKVPLEPGSSKKLDRIGVANSAAEGAKKTIH
jgi:hypothetical protein